MRSQDTFLMAFKALKDRKLRTGLTILGIVIGTSMIVALVASTTGLTTSITAQMSKMGATTLYITSTSARAPIKDEDVAVLQSVEGVKEVIPYYATRLQINYGSTTLSVQVFGFDLNLLYSLYQGLELDRGNLADMYDPTGVVIGSSIARPPEKELPSVDINEMILLQRAGATGRSSASNYAYLVKGILKPFGAAGFTNIDETIFLSSFGAMLTLKLTSYSGVIVIADSPDAVTVVQESVQNYFGTNARIMSAQSMLETVQSITGQLTLFMGGIAAVSLFVAGVGITNTMFVSIMERTREIGILKAIGYRSRNILTMFLAEASLTGIIGGILGTITGTLLSFVLSGGIRGTRVGTAGPGAGAPGMMGGASRVSSSMQFTPAITSELLIFSLLFPIGISILAGLYPAWRASRLNIVRALKYE